MSTPETATNREHLWQVDHPYYCSENNFYSNDCYHRYGTWPEYLSERGSSEDLDLNLIFRWDWKAKTYLERDDADERAAYDATIDDYYRGYTLSIFYVLQRKGIFSCVEIDVCRADEPSVREFLAQRWAHLQTLWQPLSLGAVQ